MTQKIVKYEKAKFYLEWGGTHDSELRLNFNPLIEKYNLSPPYCLLHWQARPKNLRRWGLYDGSTDLYYSFNAGEILIDFADTELLDVDERVIKTVPTAVVCFLNCKFTNNRIFYISNEF